MEQCHRLMHTLRLPNLKYLSPQQVEIHRLHQVAVEAKEDSSIPLPYHTSPKMRI